MAFIRQSGLGLIFDALKDAMDRRIAIRVLTSDYLDVTELWRGCAVVFYRG